MPYETEFLDTTPVQSPPYRHTPAKMAAFREMVNQLLEQGVVLPSKSPYTSLAFLVPKNGGGFPFEGRLPQSELQGCF